MYTLEEVVVAFESWRSSRISRKEPIPDKLWAMAKSLLPHYKKAHIQRALRLSGGQFNERCLKLHRSDEVIKEGFVEGFVESIENNVGDEGCELILKGIHKSLHIRVSMKQLSRVLPLMAGYL